MASTQPSLSSVLRLLHDAPTRYKTLRLTIFERVTRKTDALRGAPEHLGVNQPTRVRQLPAQPPDSSEEETVTELWIAEGMERIQRSVGVDPNGRTIYAVSTSYGNTSAGSNPVGPEFAMSRYRVHADPWLMISGLKVHIVGRTEWLDRDAIELSCTYRHRAPATQTRNITFGASPLTMVIDAERGILMRLQGESLATKFLREVRDLSLDEPMDDQIFTRLMPPGAGERPEWLRRRPKRARG